MVKKFTSEEFCSVAHRQAYQHEQEQLAVARLLEDQNRRKPARKQPLTQTKEKNQVPASGEYLSEPISARPIKSRPWHAHLHLLVAAKAAQPDSGSNIGGACAALVDPENSLNPVSSLGAPGLEASMTALSQAEVATTLSALDSCTSSHPSPPVAGIAVNFAVDRQISPAAPCPPEFKPVTLEPAQQAILPESHLQPQRHRPSENMDLSAAACSQLPFDLSRRYPAFVPDSIAAPSVYVQVATSALVGLPVLMRAAIRGSLREVGAPIDPAGALLPARLKGQPRQNSSAGVAIPNLQKPCLSKSRPPLGDLLSVPMAPPVQPDSKPSLSDSKPPSPTFAQPLAYLPNLAVVHEPATRLLDLPDPAIVCYAGSIQRLFSRPRPSAPRAVRLVATGEYPQPAQATVIPSQSDSADKMLAIPLGKCKPFDGLFPHPESFLRSIPGKWAATETFFAFHQPFTPKARIASVRRASLSLNVDPVRDSRQAKIKVRPDPGNAESRMFEWVLAQGQPILKPELNLPISPAPTSNSAIEALSAFSSGGHAISWAAVQRHWRDAPNDLRWIALAVPLIVGLIWFADSPSAQNGAKSRIASMVPNVGNLFKISLSGDSLDGLKQNIQRRAAVELSDDFRQGLGEWSGAGDWSKGWSYDSAGFIRPRKLALYTPSLALEDYRFEFLGAIERRALSWVVRAADIKNYYAYRLEITRSGPLPTVELVRHSVIDGRSGSRKSIPLHLQARLDSIYRVRLDVSGSDLVTTIQGQVVDVFSDGRLPRGGVGFFSESGDDSRLRWIEVSHQYDMLGRLCAYLVPYNVSNSNVRSAP